MQKEELKKSITHLLNTTELSNKEIAEQLNTTHQKVTAIANKLQKGLGDKIADFTEKTGIKKVVDALIKDCGCKKRQEALNAGTRLRVVRDPRDSDLETIYELTKEEKKEFTPGDRIEIAKIRSHIFNVRYSVMNCHSCGKILKAQLNELKVVFDAYTEPI